MIVEDEDENFNDHYGGSAGGFSNNGSAIAVNQYGFQGGSNNNFNNFSNPYSQQAYVQNISSISGGNGQYQQQNPSILGSQGGGTNVKKSQNFDSMQPLLNGPQSNQYSREQSISP